VVPDRDLNQRQEAESSFHEHKYRAGDSMPRHYRVRPTYPVFERMLGLLEGRLRDARVLEYGCGTGWITEQLAARGAVVSAFDISHEAVLQTKANLQAKGLADRCQVRVLAAERLDYPDGAFDLAIGFAILHHLELQIALSELHRVLRCGGKAFFAEPLAGNPAINLYRRLTPQYRSPDERPIRLDEFGRLATGFKAYEHHDQLVLATGAAVMGHLPGVWRAAAPCQKALMRVDDVLLRLCPACGRLAWYSILVLEK
jgi:SAM-dependent methyltransferase